MEVTKILGLCLLCTVLEVQSINQDCGKLDDKNQIPWTVGIYFQKEKHHLDLVCLGTILGEKHIITAAQCVCEPFSKRLKKENIYVSTDIRKEMEINPNTIKVDSKDVIYHNNYKGFLLNPAADVAVIKLKNSQKIGYPVCVDWSDVNLLLQKQKTGLISSWNDQGKSLDATYEDYDSCYLSTSEFFNTLLSSDKNCFRIPVSDLSPQSIGTGVYYRNPKDDKWYLEGVVSSKEATKGEAIVAASSIRKYLPWLTRVFA